MQVRDQPPAPSTTTSNPYDPYATTQQSPPPTSNPSYNSNLVPASNPSFRQNATTTALATATATAAAPVAYNPYHATAPPEEEITVSASDVPVAYGTQIVSAEDNKPTGSADLPLVQAQSSAIQPYEPPAIPTSTTSTAMTTTTTASLVSGYGGLLLSSVPAGQAHRLTLKNNLWFNSSPDQTGTIFYTETNRSFPIRLQSNFQGKSTQLLIMDDDFIARAVIRKNDPTSPDKFHVFTAAPLTPNQSPSLTMRLPSGQPLYTCGSLASEDGMLPYNSKHKYKFLLQHGWQLSARRNNAGWLGNRNKNQPAQYQIQLQAHQVHVSQRNVQIQNGAVQATVSLNQTPSNIWLLDIPAQFSQDPTLVVLLALMLDELSFSRK